MNSPIVSICIPSYNRPDELIRLLKSIDFVSDEIEVIICEDKSPARKIIAAKVSSFMKQSELNINYHENLDNLGYDGNIRELVRKSSGDFILFMGDDDVFVNDSLVAFIDFLKKNSNIAYVLKSHLYTRNDGTVERFRYYKGHKFFDPGEATLVELLRKSVFISGFTIKRSRIRNYLTDYFDGTLLMQIYFLAEVTLHERCAYYDIPLTMQYEEGIPYFGSSETEKNLYTPGEITTNNSINFLKGFIKITNYIDQKYNLNTTKLVQKDMSKYFYPNLALHRNKGFIEFIKYVCQLNKLKFNASIYYYMYIFALVFIGKNTCDKLIRKLKDVLGSTPKL